MSITNFVDQMVAAGRFGGSPEAAAEIRRLLPDDPENRLYDLSFVAQ